jgi:hypothetical protein
MDNGLHCDEMVCNKKRRKINFPILGFESEAERFISSELPIQNPLIKLGSNFLRHTKRCTTLKQKYKTSVLQDENYFSFFSENTEI